MHLLSALEDVLLRRLSDGGRAAWRAVRDGAGDASAVLSASAGLGRRFGGGPLALDAADRALLAGAGVDWPLQGWSVDDLGRAALLVAAAARMEKPAVVELAELWWRGGEPNERRALMRTLPLLPDPERFVPLAREACRTHVTPVFEALALDNPYPARFFPDAAFCQMTLKALFVGSPLSRVLGLPDRVDDELRRMVEDFARERRLAGRPVPSDVGYVLSLAAPEGRS